MPILLDVEISPSGSRSISREISAEYIKVWKEKNPTGQVVLRDLDKNPVPHLDQESISAHRIPEEQRTPSISEKLAYRKTLIAEVLAADEILISLPMWNWSTPSVLKAYFDQIILVGTLDASRNRNLAGKKVTYILAQGSSYIEGAPREGWDFATGYMKHVATVLGSTDVELIIAEYQLAGIAPGMDEYIDAKAKSVEKAKIAAKKRAA
ncbi:MAG: NAD(P)H-dependent oxidoreductase [Actinomycetota bacterium]